MATDAKSEDFAGNFIDADKIRDYARRASARIPSPHMRDRFTRVVFDVLRDDPRNARPAEAGELALGPDWALRDHLLGKPVYAFDPDPSAVAVVKSTVRDLRATCDELDYYINAENAALTPHQRVMRHLVKEFHAKIARMPFAVIADKAHRFQRERRRRLDQLKAEEILFSREEVFTAPGRRWERVRSTSALGAVGREMQNCLSDGSPHHKRYGRALRDNVCSFWVLRDYVGVALMAVMIHTAANRVGDVRGPRNRQVFDDDPDLAILVAARGASLTGASGLSSAERRRAAK